MDTNRGAVRSLLTDSLADDAPLARQADFLAGSDLYAVVAGKPHAGPEVVKPRAPASATDFDPADMTRLLEKSRRQARTGTACRATADRRSPERE